MKKISFIVCLSFLLSASSVFGNESINTIPSSWGLYSSFLKFEPGELAMLSKTGARWVRIPLFWNMTEKEKGRYDFSLYDQLVNELESFKIRPLFILWYSNPFYDNDLSPYTDEGRQAFANWVSASVKRFSGKGIIWELWNEPNVNNFWKPRVNVENYIKLALVVGKAIQDISPREIYVGPATSMVDFNFLKSCFRAGLLEYWSGITVHPYRHGPPETWGPELNKLKALIRLYSPSRKYVPVLTGEWGYSTWDFSEEKQSKYLMRQFLFNLANSVPLTIWFEWKDNFDPKDSERHFGIVNNLYQKGKETVFNPKPAYVASKTFSEVFDGFQFFQELGVGRNFDYILVFKKGDQIRLAAWTISRRPHKVRIPVSSGKIEEVSYLGERKVLNSSKEGFFIQLTDSPRYYVVENSEDVLKYIANESSNSSMIKDGACVASRADWRCRQE